MHHKTLFVLFLSRLCLLNVLFIFSGVFSTAYASYLWNLIARSDNVQTMSFASMSVVDDAIAVRFNQIKNDQEGCKHTDNKHCYANPHDPSQCPITALGVYFLVNPELQGEMVFPSDHETAHFLKNMQGALDKPDVRNKLESYGLRKKDMGTHSHRKGAETSISVGTTAPPGPDATMIRAGRALAGSKNAYIEGGGAGDRYCGRLLAGLNVHSHTFADLPPHFFVSSEAERATVNDAVEQCFPTISKKGEGNNMQGVCQRILASLVFHGQPGGYLDTLDDSHPVTQTLLFTDANLLTTLWPLVQGGNLENDVSGLKATGIPPHTEVKVELPGGGERRPAGGRQAQKEAEAPERVALAGDAVRMDD
jgi:hypothetical protein